MRPLRQKQMVQGLGRPGYQDVYNVNRLDSSGTGHDYLFCDQDYADYVNKLKDFDNSFDSWMQNGGKRNG